MAQEGFKRKLAAIFSADVAGYSRLMDDDEEATVSTLNLYRNLMTKLIQQYRGRVVDTTGDNLLAEFTSAVDAVNCAVEVQRELAEHNTELSYQRKMEFRLGVNVGDVIEEKDQIYGDNDKNYRCGSSLICQGLYVNRIAPDLVEQSLAGETHYPSRLRPVAA